MILHSVLLTRVFLLLLHILLCIICHLGPYLLISLLFFLQSLPYMDSFLYTYNFYIYKDCFSYTYYCTLFYRRLSCNFFLHFFIHIYFTTSIIPFQVLCKNICIHPPSYATSSLFLVCKKGAKPYILIKRF